MKKIALLFLTVCSCSLLFGQSPNSGKKAPLPWMKQNTAAFKDRVTAAQNAVKSYNAGLPANAQIVDNCYKSTGRGTPLYCVAGGCALVYVPEGNAFVCADNQFVADAAFQGITTEYQCTNSTSGADAFSGRNSCLTKTNDRAAKPKMITGTSLRCHDPSCGGETHDHPVKAAATSNAKQKAASGG
jgi:hypothetical protein